jgi:uncharacterized protein (DUF111 family)
MAKHLHWDPVGGAAGDMVLGALVDLGGAAESLLNLPVRLGLTGVNVVIGQAARMGIVARTVSVSVTGTPRVRHLKDIHALLAATNLPEAVKAQALEVFGRLAAAEAKVHGTSVEKVHFHEVGADDAIIDIVGACLLASELGIDSQSYGPLPLAHGTIRAAHGQVPLPAPAVLELISGSPVNWLEEPGERVTPTGAALLVTLARPGYPPNGSATEQVEIIDELVAAIDDGTGEELALAAEILLGSGALDVYYSPLVMKKGRPGWQLTVLALPARSGSLTELIFRHTPTAGVRQREIRRHILSRESVTVDTGWGPVRMKVLTSRGGECRATPEYEDCRMIAQEKNRPLIDVQQRARAAYRKFKGE